MDFGIVVILATAATLLSLTLLAIALVMPKLSERAALKRRIEMLGDNVVRTAADSNTGGRSSRRRDIQSRLREAEASKNEKVPLSIKLRRELRGAGINIELRAFLILCAALGATAVILYLAAGYPPVFAPVIAITAGAGVPKYIVGSLTKRRVKNFTKEFSNAIDVIVRGIRSGLPVGECLKIIATESPEPVGGVFREIVESQNVGLTLDRALERAQEQMSTAELKFFAIVLSIQAQTGGNLADTLQNLSNILRERKKMADKVKALSSEARSSAMIIGSLPFLMTGLLWLVSPDYIMPLFTDSLGQILVACGLGWMAIGVFIMKQMVSFEI